MKKISFPIYQEKAKSYLGVNEDVSLKVLLVATPQSHPPTAPHPALPYLKGYLGEVLPNVSVNQKDLDAIYFSYIFRQSELEKAFSPEDAARIRTAYEAQRNIQVYKDIPRFIDAHKTLEDALDEISRQHQEKYGLEKESLRLRGNTFTYVSEQEANSREGILKSVSPENREKNLFYDYFKNEVVPYILKGNYDVVGLSVPLTDQLIPTFLLASMIKEADSNIKVVVGGNYVSRFSDVFSKNNELNNKLFDTIDALVVKNGEVPFRKILERAYESPKGAELDLDGVSQVIYKIGNEVKSNLPLLLPNISPHDLPRPDFDGIFSDMEGKEQVFWTPSPVISMYTQRGCPYVTDRCEFCAIPTGNNVPGSGLQRSAEKVAEDMEYFQKKYNTKYFSFGNETLWGKFMLALTEELDKRGLEAVIDGYTRTNQFANGQLDTDMVKKISKYFRFLQIGFESANEETLDSMKKGRKPFRDSELAKALFENNAYAHAFLMTGFPPEKEKYEGKGRDNYVNFYVRSGIETLKWLLDNQYSVGTYKNTKLVLPRDAKMVEWKDGKAILREEHSHEIVLRQHRDLEYNIPYEKINGSKKLDDAMTALFDLVQTPYRAFTHNAVYHQRQFMWDEGIRWSLKNPDAARELFPISEERAKKVLKKLWNAAVGQDYISAVEELKRIEGKGGINAERKRERLQKTIDETREKNTIAKKFPKPDGLQSIEDLLELAA